MNTATVRLTCSACLKHNAAIIEAFKALDDSVLTDRSHYIDGRYENLYVERGSLPALVPLLDTIQTIAAQQLGREPETLKMGFWFNAMQPGQRTSLHSHDDNDELLSGVYYLAVPENSGNLIFHRSDQLETVQPGAGLLVLFSPELLHEVSENRSNAERLSLAFNIGPA